MEQVNNGEEHEGEKYLRILGLSHLADKPVIADGRTIQARDFLEVCGKDARPLLVGFESMNQDDPGYVPTRDLLRKFISKYIEVPNK